MEKSTLAVWQRIFGIGIILASWLTMGIMPKPATMATTISLKPTASEIYGCQTVVVEIWVNDVTELYGADVRLSFDPNILEVVDVSATPGVQILPLNQLLYPDFVVLNSADNNAGTIEYALTQLNPRPAATGSGALALVLFRAKNAGISPIDFTYTQLANRDGEELSATPVNNAMQAFAPAPTSGSLSSTLVGTDTVRINWATVSGATDYNLYRDTTPYFAPTPPSYALLTSTPYDDVGAAGDTDPNYYYVFEAACSNGFASDSNVNRVGEFDFAISPGQP